MEDSIERVLLVLKEEQDDSDSMEGDFDGIEEPAPVLKVGNLMQFAVIILLMAYPGAQYHE